MRALLFRLLSVYAALALCRLVFYVYNAAAFEGLTGGELAAIFVYALRFDTSSLLYVNAPVILLHLLPLPWQGARPYEALKKGVFYLCNTPMLVLELSDAVYFPYAFRRMLRGDFGMQSDIKNLIPQFLRDFWWLVLLLILMLAAMEMGYRYAARRFGGLEWRGWRAWLVLPLGAAVAVVGMRGGLQLRPLMPQAAVGYVSDTRFMPLVSNTTLGLIHSFQQSGIAPRDYFDEATLNQLLPLQKHPGKERPFRRLNLVFLVMESLGCEYVGYFNPGAPSQTPFLDSLLSEGLLFESMYANGTRSTQGIVAVAGGFPALMDDPLMFSQYQSNRLVSIGNLLEKQGYTTAFFHPGEVGTMDFDKFCPLAGLKRYYGRSHYEAAKGGGNYDGNWGIWDMPFYDYAAEEMDGYAQPFFAVLFSINPHHPFNVQPDFERLHPDLPPLQRAIRYADENLRRFWTRIRQSPWFGNTLFVLTADHIGPAQSARYHRRVARYSIPLWLHAPGDSLLRGRRGDVCQQIDIAPTALGYLGYPLPYPALGRNLLDSTQLHLAYHYSYEAEIFQIVEARYALQRDAERNVALFDHRSDTLLERNLLGTLPQVEEHLERQIKAAIQRHNRILLNNSWE